jgi:hypothetical protein
VELETVGEGREAAFPPGKKAGAANEGRGAGAVTGVVRLRFFSTGTSGGEAAKRSPDTSDGLEIRFSSEGEPGEVRADGGENSGAWDLFGPADALKESACSAVLGKTRACNFFSAMREAGIRAGRRLVEAKYLLRVFHEDP